MNLLVTGAWKCTEEQLTKIKEAGHIVYWLQNENEALPVDYAQIEGVICNGLFNHHDIRKFSNLRYIQLISAGYDRVPMDYITERGIQIHNARGVYSIPMAEFAVQAVLQFYKQSRFFYANQQACRWEKKRNLLELTNKVVCIIGCGSVGLECAKRFKAFGCKVVGVDLETSEKEGFEKIITIGNLDEILKYSDVVILALPLTEHTHHLMNKSRINSLKRECVLVNIARGGIIDIEALLERLKREELYAAIDVYEKEPLSEDSLLWNINNLILTPHNSFVGDCNADRLYNVIIENIKGK